MYWSHHDVHHSQSAQPWLCSEYEQIPKDLLHIELNVGKRNVGLPRYKDVCKRDLKSLNINIGEWEKQQLRSLVSNRLREREKQFFGTRINFVLHLPIPKFN